MALSMWNIRSGPINFNVNEVYVGHPTLFSLLIHYGGNFTRLPGREYINGNDSYIDFLDADEFSILELDSMMLQLGYDGTRRAYYHFKRPGSNLDVGLLALVTDSDVIKLTNFVPEHRLLEVYIELETTKVHQYLGSTSGLVPETESRVEPQILPLDNVVSQDFNSTFEEVHSWDQEEEVFDKHQLIDNEGSDEIEDDDDDFIIDEDNMLHDVDVDMRDFHLNVDSEVEWVGHSTKPFETTDGDSQEVDVLDHEEFESLSDSEDSSERIRRRKLKDLKKKNKNDKCDDSVKRIQFYVGQTFHTSSQVKEAIKNHAIETRRNIVMVKNDRIRVRAVCKGSIPNLYAFQNGGPSNARTILGKEVKTQQKTCPWVLHVSRWREEDEWMVKTFNEAHTCLQSRKIKACTATYLSKQIVEQIEGNPTIPLKALQEELQKKYEIGVSKMKVFRAKTKAVTQVMGDYKMQYAILRDYVLELKAANEDTTVKIDVESEPNVSTGISNLLV